jgi:hypothetical protein
VAALPQLIRVSKNREDTVDADLREIDELFDDAFVHVSNVLDLI